MLTKLFKVFVLVTLISPFLSPYSEATKKLIPIDPFFERYEKASVVALGSVDSIEDTDFSIKELNPGTRVQKKLAHIKISKVWKGNVKSGQIVDVYYMDGLSAGEEFRLGNLAHFFTSKKLIYFLYLRESDGHFFTATRYGYDQRNKGKVELDPEYLALDAFTSGKSKADVYPFLDSRSKEFYKDQFSQAK